MKTKLNIVVPSAYGTYSYFRGGAVRGKGGVLNKNGGVLNNAPYILPLLGRSKLVGLRKCDGRPILAHWPRRVVQSLPRRPGRADTAVHACVEEQNASPP